MSNEIFGKIILLGMFLAGLVPFVYFIGVFRNTFDENYIKEEIQKRNVRVSYTTGLKTETSVTSEAIQYWQKNLRIMSILFFVLCGGLMIFSIALYFHNLGLI